MPELKALLGRIAEDKAAIAAKLALEVLGAEI